MKTVIICKKNADDSPETDRSPAGVEIPGIALPADQVALGELPAAGDLRGKDRSGWDTAVASTSSRSLSERFLSHIWKSVTLPWTEREVDVVLDL